MLFNIRIYRYQVHNVCKLTAHIVLRISVNFVLNGIEIWKICIQEWSQVAQSVVWLRVGLPGDRGSIPGRGEGFFL
jgi:hypothetical protein